VESTTYAKTLQNKALQDSHTAHCSLAVHTVAAVPAKTANKPLIRIRALIARIIVAHIVKEAKRLPSQPSQHRSDSGRPLTTEMKQVLGPVMKVSGSYTLWGKHFEDYNGLENGCLLIGLSQKYGKPTLRPSETLSVNTCAFVGTDSQNLLETAAVTAQFLLATA
jgi:hypothetical protein